MGRKLVMDRFHRTLYGAVDSTSQKRHTHSPLNALGGMGTLEQVVEQSWTSHQIVLLDEIKSLAGGALDI